MQPLLGEKPAQLVVANRTANKALELAQLALAGGVDDGGGTVELDGGRTISVVQARDQSFAVGERVRVYTRRDGAARVAKT